MNIFNTVLQPKSIAIVGASRSPHKVGHQVLQNILDSGYKGRIYPINPKAHTINKLKVYPSLLDLPATPDLVIIVTPAGLVEPVVQEAIRIKAPAAIIITAGFAESGPKGLKAQQQLQTIAQGKIRLIGPNCLGVLSPVHHINAAFGPKLQESGHVMLISQSGAMVTGVLDWAQLNQLGISHAVTFGNRIDVSEVDALEYALHDKHTKVVLCYLESFQDAPAFFSLCSQVTPTKPVILLKGGSSKSGQAASASHTAALATNQVLVQAMADQTGVILAEDMNHWLRSAEMFLKTKPSIGPDIAIVTNAGGPGVVTSDEAESRSLSIKPITGQSKKLLNQSLTHIPAGNPLDIRGDATPEDFATALSILKKDPIQDALVVIITPQTTTQPKKAAQEIINQAKSSKKPIIVVLIGGAQMQSAKNLLDKAGISTHAFPAEAVKLLATKINYEASRNQIHQFPAQHSVSPAKTTLTPDTLTLKASFRTLKSAGFNLPKYQIVSKVSDVPSALKLTQRPAIAKTASMSLAHKVLSGGVIMGIMTNSKARIAFRKLQSLDADVLFQQTIHAQHEVIIGAKRDPQFGPFITVGFGGGLTDALQDRQYAFAPARKSYFKQILKQTKLYQKIQHNPKQTESVIKALTQAQTIILSHSEIQEFEINPLLLTPRSAYAVDIKITLK